MTFLRSCFLALLVFVAAPAWAAGDPDWLYRGSDIPRDPAWTFGSLPNGVRYAVRRNALPAGQVSIRVRIDTGSMNEEENERGWAHLVEHMAFRGSKSFGDREARHIWQQLGASFGSDTNASTTPTQTVYQLDLPKNDAANLDQSLHVLSEMVDTSLFDPAAVEAEKKIVLAERGRIPELAFRMQETSWPLFYAGLRYADRLTIGTEATLQAANAERLRAFYERWYRPERATVIMVGDADPKLMEQLIAKRFGDWKGTGPAPKEPDYGSIRRLNERAAAVTYPGAPYAANLMWLRPYRRLPNTRARERLDLARSLAERIVNRRLEAKARTGASYVGAGVNETRSTNVADMTQLSITAREGKWQEAMAETFAIIADALRAPPSQAEIARELQNMRSSGQSAVQGEPTVRSPQWAQQLVTAIDGNSIVASSATSLALLEEFSPQMTPAAVAAATRELFSGAGPRLVLLSPQPVTLPAVNQALVSAEKAAPAVRRADRAVSFDTLPKLGTPGKVVSRQRIEDFGVDIVRFANGSSLVFKKTDYEKGSVQVQLRFGEGLTGLSPTQPSLAWLSGLVGPSGVADLDLDAMERLLTGRRISIGFAASDDAFVLGGRTNGTDLADQLRLLATKLAYPRWDEQLFARSKAGSLESYDLSFASASSRAGREFGAFTRSGDKRWSAPEKAEIAATTPADFQRFFTPLLANGPIEAIIVGDVEVETAIAAVASSIGALPDRAPARIAPGARDVRPPAPNPTPKTFTHNGDKNQAYAAIGWNTFGGTERRRERRALSLAANMFRVRLFDRLREEEGASYSPSANSVTSDELPEWGIFYAASELRPESAPVFFRIAREIVADLAAKPAAADEFARAQNPIVSGIERRLKTNAYWLSEMEGWSREPERMERTR
ncbi:MAG TPA: insulinase family protein, partial [Allosphingosinicella sp.]